MNNSTTAISVDCFGEGDILYYSLLVVIAIIIVCINCGVIYTMATNSLLRTKRNAFLASLTASDLLTGLIAIPLHILCSCYHESIGDLCLAQAICFRFIAISTMLNIFMITVERYIGIIYPLKYTFILTKTRVVILLSCTWATSVSSAMVCYSWLKTSNAGSERPTKEAENWERAYFIFAFITFFFLPLVVMIVMYTRMFITISRARKSLGKSRMNQTKTAAKLSGSKSLERIQSRSYNSFGDRCGAIRYHQRNEDNRIRSKSLLTVPRTEIRMNLTPCQSSTTVSRSLQSSVSLSSEKFYEGGNIGGSSVSFARKLSDACGSAAARVGLVRLANSEERLGQTRMAREHRVLIIFVTMLSVFVICWLSWYIMLFNIVRIFAVPDIVLDCFDIMRFSVSFFNPILYTFLKTDFRIAFAKSCGCRRSCAGTGQTKTMKSIAKTTT